MMHQANSGFVRDALLANFLFSSVCALALLSIPETIAGLIFAGGEAWFGCPAALTLFSLGIGLSLFAALLLYYIRRSWVLRSGVLAIIVGDVAWVVVSAIALILAPSVLTPTGLLLVFWVAVAVLIVALCQSFGLGLLYQGETAITLAKQDRMLILTASREVPVSAARAWEVMVDHPRYADVADNLSSVEVLEGDGEGMCRRCTAKPGEVWTETAHLYEEGKRYGFTVHTKAEDYPYPFDRLRGEWEVAPINEARSRVLMRFEITPESGLKGAIIRAVMGQRVAPMVDRLLRRWEGMMAET